MRQSLEDECPLTVYYADDSETVDDLDVLDPIQQGERLVLGILVMVDMADYLMGSKDADSLGWVEGIVL